MRHSSFWVAAVSLIPLAAWPGPQRVNERARVLSEFQRRVEAYLELRRDAAKGLPKLEETRNPAEVTARQQALARAIQAARAGARQGDIFFPEAAALLKDEVRRDLERRPPPERAAATAVPAAPGVGVNDTYPTAIPLATVPPRMLARLPRLPETLEYRLLGRRLILRDVDANLVVDYVDGALPRG